MGNDQLYDNAKLRTQLGDLQAKHDRVVDVLRRITDRFEETIELYAPDEDYNLIEEAKQVIAAASN